MNTVLTNVCKLGSSAIPCFKAFIVGRYGLEPTHPFHCYSNTDHSYIWRCTGPSANDECTLKQIFVSYPPARELRDTMLQSVHHTKIDTSLYTVKLCLGCTSQSATHMEWVAWRCSSYGQEPHYAATVYLRVHRTDSKRTCNKFLELRDAFTFIIQTYG